VLSDASNFISSVRQVFGLCKHLPVSAAQISGKNYFWAICVFTYLCLVTWKKIFFNVFDSH